MSDWQNIANQFVQHYYQQFDTNRAGLAALYTNTSMLTYENEQFMGTEKICEKLATLPGIKHGNIVMDAQPSVNNAIICMVSGDLMIEGSDNAIKFTQVFYLAPGGAQGYYCHHDIFRLSLG